MQTEKKSKVWNVIEARTLGDKTTVYLAVSDITRRTKYIVGKEFKTLGNVVPKGTEYHTTFDKAYDAFNKFA